jgi:hypothetical protein
MKNNSVYKSIVPLMAVILVIMAFVLCININMASQRPIYVVTKTGETDSQKIEKPSTDGQYSLVASQRPTDAVTKNRGTDSQKIEKPSTDGQYLSQAIYTIQTGSFLNIERAQEEFDSIIQILNKRELEYLRIEKVDKYYSVRLGNFKDYAIADKFLHTHKRHLSAAVILKAYIKDERIVKRYNVNVSEEKKENKINVNYFEAVNERNVVLPLIASFKNELQKSLSIPLNERPLLFGTVIHNDDKLAIIEDRGTKQAGFYRIHDRVMGFIVTGIFEDKVILQKHDGFIEIGLRDSKDKIEFGHYIDEIEFGHDIDEIELRHYIDEIELGHYNGIQS